MNKKKIRKGTQSPEISPPKSNLSSLWNLCSRVKGVTHLNRIGTQCCLLVPPKKTSNSKEIRGRKATILHLRYSLMRWIIIFFL
jgi:hypothetical protein